MYASKLYITRVCELMFNHFLPSPFPIHKMDVFDFYGWNNKKWPLI